MTQMQVLFLSAEAAPLIKIGGLGDVAGALPSALRSLPDGPDIRICLPFYRSIRKKALNLEPAASFMIEHRSGPMLAEVFQGKIDGVPAYFVNGPPIASSSEVYSGDNYKDGKKFIFFSLAAIELARILKWRPDIIHAQDWHTAPAIYKLHRIRKLDDFYNRT